VRCDSHPGLELQHGPAFVRPMPGQLLDAFEVACCRTRRSADICDIDSLYPRHASGLKGKLAALAACGGP